MPSPGGATPGPGELAAIQKASGEQALIPASAGDHRRGPGWQDHLDQPICASWRPSACEFCSAAPSRPAAKRRAKPPAEAKTIHRFLEFDPAACFKRNAELPAGVRSVGVDETRWWMLR